MDASNAPGASENARWLQRYRAVHARASLRDHDPAFGPVFTQGHGSRLWDVDGDDWIDLTCGYSASNFGHAYEPLVAAATEQLGQLTHLTGEPHPGRIRLAERLVQLLGGMLNAPLGAKVCFNSSGARAVETAWKAACAFRTGRLVALAPGFHGRSIATAAISATSKSGISQALQDRVAVWPKENYPICDQCPLGLSFPSCDVRCATGLLEYLEQQAEHIAAIIVEPALGARGYVFPPADFFLRLRQVTARHQILLIADEVQTGLGRCGDWLLSHVQGWRPDLVVLGKSLGGGITPISAVVGRADVLDCIPEGAESETFAATPLATAVALKVLELVESRELFARGVQLGLELRQMLEIEFAAVNQSVRVSGTAATCVAEFSCSESPIIDCQQRARRFAETCVIQKIRVHLSGPSSTRVVLLPPLTMSNDELADAKQRLRAAVEQLANELPSVG